MFRRSAYASPPGSTPSRASTGRHRTISCQRTLSVEGCLLFPRPHLQLGPLFRPSEAGLDPPDLSETPNSAPAFCSAGVLTGDPSFGGQRPPLQPPPGTHTLIRSALFLRSIQAFLWSERRGLNQVGGITEENLLGSSPYPKAFRVSTSWCFRPGRTTRTNHSSGHGS